MSDTQLTHTETALVPAPPVHARPRRMLSLQTARSLRAIEHVLEHMIRLAEKPLPSNAEILRRQREVRRLLIKTRKVAWIWANVYGYGADDLFPEPLYHPNAAYLAVVQAGVIIVLDSERKRIACFESDDGFVWNRHSIHRRSPLTNPSVYVCRVKR
ncbi:MAG: hypothetical protein FJZ97_00975 [Chloroflexi bacterium]|nr:hypothetical protein [Chloroflexota bacterium]